MEERIKFILRVREAVESFARSCRRFSVSRKTGYKWWRRFCMGGLEGLWERSSRPLRSPSRCARKWRNRVIRLRSKHPYWGPKKLHAKLAMNFGRVGLPVPSSFGRILVAEGLVKARRRRCRGPEVPRASLSVSRAANEIWAMDFKGWFRTGNGKRCEPLTISDLFSRYVLCCQALPDQSYERVRPIIERVFRTYGLPEKIRVDNGGPFGSIGAGGLSRLSVWWLRLGIQVEFIEPGHPEENGSHERMHRGLKAEATQPPERTTPRQQRRFERWVLEFNYERPHEALGQVTPASLYKKSKRVYREPQRELIYPEDYEVRRVRSNGQIKWQGKRQFIGEAFCGQRVGLMANGEGKQQVYFAGWLLGELRDGEGGLLPAVRMRAKKNSSVRDGQPSPKVDGRQRRACSPGPGESVTRGDRRRGELEISKAPRRRSPARANSTAR